MITTFSLWRYELLLDQHARSPDAIMLRAWRFVLPSAIPQVEQKALVEVA
jgi:hypothetical protein